MAAIQSSIVETVGSLVHEPRTTNNASATTPTAANNNNDSTHLFIHVGPVKTGSTSIQCNLQVNPFLKVDSYYFLGKMDRQCAPTKHRLVRPQKEFMHVQAFVFQYIKRGWFQQEVHLPYRQSFIEEMNQRNRHGIQTILSGEEFCGILGLPDDLFQLFANLLDELEQEVTFQVVYRDFFEWAVSRYSFYELWHFPVDKFQGRSMASILDDKVVDVFAVANTKACSPHDIWAYFNSKLPAFRKKVRVEVFNMHGEGDVGNRYVCSLPNAQNACEASMKNLHLGTSRPTNMNLLHSDRIAAAAWKAEMFYNASMLKTRRREINQVIQDHVQNHLNSSFIDLPLECLSEEQLESLLQVSLRYGEDMLGNDFNAENMKSKFQKQIEQKKFCSVNVSAVLLDPDWQNFLQSERLLG